MKQKLSISDIAGYLPYSLRVLSPNGEIYTIGVYPKTYEGFCINEETYKPILRPFADLINGDGEYTHINQLASIVQKGVWLNPKEFTPKEKDKCYKVYTCELTESPLIFVIQVKDTKLHTMFLSDKISGDRFNIENMMNIMEFFYQHHYDVNGLIDKGIAIDINEIKNI